MTAIIKYTCPLSKNSRVVKTGLMLRGAVVALAVVDRLVMATSPALMEDEVDREVGLVAGRSPLWFSSLLLDLDLCLAVFDTPVLDVLAVLSGGCWVLLFPRALALLCCPAATVLGRTPLELVSFVTCERNIVKSYRGTGTARRTHQL